MKKILNIVLITLVSVALISCGETTTETTEETKLQTLELLSDTSFLNGFTITPADNDPQPNNRYPLDYDLTYSDSTGDIQWLLCQHGCRYGLADKYTIDGEDVLFDNGYYYIQDTAKELVIGTEDNSLTFTVNTSLEYLAPRKDKEAWPHLIIEQGLVNQVEIKDLDELNLKMNVTLNKSDLMMSDTEYNESLHTAQFIMYIVVRTNSALDSGEFIWFGIPVYDARYNYIAENGMIDAGTSGNTGMFIYHSPSNEYLPNSLPIGIEQQIDFDLIPYLSRALALAKQQDKFLNSTIEDLYLTSMNIGWEIPGTYDVSITISDFSLVADFKD